MGCLGKSNISRNRGGQGMPKALQSHMGCQCERCRRICQTNFRWAGNDGVIAKKIKQDEEFASKFSEACVQSATKHGEAPFQKSMFPCSVLPHALPSLRSVCRLAPQHIDRSEYIYLLFPTSFLQYQTTKVVGVFYLQVQALYRAF